MDLNKIYSLMDNIDSSFLLSEEAMFLIEATRDEIYDVYYDEQNGRAKRIARQIFDTICNMDPTARENQVGPFAKWIFNMWDTPKMNEGQLEEYMGMPETFQRDVQTFVKLKNVKCPYIQYDLNRYDLNTFKLKMAEARDNDWDKSKKELMNDGTMIVYEDSDWKLLVPLKYESEKKYGSGTAWCTAPNENTYRNYSGKGRLLIIINKKNPITLDGSEIITPKNRNPKRKYQILVWHNGLIDRNARWECCDANDSHFDYKTEFPENIVKVIDDFALRVKEEYKKVHGSNIENIVSKTKCAEDSVKYEYEIEAVTKNREEPRKVFLLYSFLDGRLNRTYSLVNKETGELLECKGVCSFYDVSNNISRYKLPDNNHQFIRLILSTEVDGINSRTITFDITDNEPLTLYGYGDWTRGFEFADGLTCYCVCGNIDNDWGTIIVDSEKNEIVYDYVKGELSSYGVSELGEDWVVGRITNSRRILYNKTSKKFIYFSKSRVVHDVYLISDNYMLVGISKSKKVILENNSGSVVSNSKGKPLFVEEFFERRENKFGIFRFLKEKELDGLYNLNTLSKPESTTEGTELVDIYKTYSNSPDMASIKYPNGETYLNFVSIDGDEVTPIELLGTYKYDVQYYSYISIYHSNDVVIIRCIFKGNTPIYFMCDYSDIKNPKFKIIAKGSIHSFQECDSIHNFGDNTSFLMFKRGDRYYAARFFDSDDGIDYEFYKSPIKVSYERWNRCWIIGNNVFTDNEMYKKLFKKKPCYYVS